MTDHVSANTDDLDAFVEHGQSLQKPLLDVVETLAKQRNYLLAAGLPHVVDHSEIPTLDNTLAHMADLDQFVEDISTALKNWGDDVGQGVFQASAARITNRLEGTDDDRLDAIAQALRSEGLDPENARRIREELEAQLTDNPRFELDGATASEPDDLAAAIVQNIDDRANELIDINRYTSSTLHAQPRLSVDQLAADLHYGNNDDPLVPENLLVDRLRSNLTDAQNNKLDEQLEQLEQREQIANFSLIEDATEGPEIGDDFDDLAAEAQLLFEDNLTGPGMYGGGHRLNEPEIAYQLQKVAEDDPGKALGLKWILEGLMDPDQRAELDRALAGEASWSDRIDRAIAHPVDGAQGAAKGSWNKTFGWFADELADAQVAATHGMFGMATGSNPTLSPGARRALPQAPTTWEELDSIVEIELEMDNIAEQGGDDLALAIDIATGLYGGGKAGLTIVRIGRRCYLRSGRTIIGAARGAPLNSRGRLPRTGNRTVFTQTGPTCGPTSCAMTLDTLGHQIDNLDDLVARFHVGPRGMNRIELARDLKAMGIDAKPCRFSIEDIATRTRSGSPIVVFVKHPGPGGTGHAVVADGITTRYGTRVIALRDPHGRQYLEDLEVFRKRFLRQGVTIEG